MISSPNYPQSSPPAEGEYCEWRITGTHGERIIINITDIDIYETNNCENGYLEIRDGYWFKSPLIGMSSFRLSRPKFKLISFTVGKYCGQGEIQTAMMSKGHRLLISYMATPNQHNHRGFNMTYEGWLHYKL